MMAKNRIVYVSCPVSIPQTQFEGPILRAIRTEVPGSDLVDYWRRGEYYDKLSVIQMCEAFVLILPRAAWNCKFSDLPPGCMRELKLAVSYRKPVFIVYQKACGDYKVYDSHFLYDSCTYNHNNTTHNMVFLIMNSNKTYIVGVENTAGALMRHMYAKPNEGLGKVKDLLISDGGLSGEYLLKTYYAPHGSPDNRLLLFF